MFGIYLQPLIQEGYNSPMRFPTPLLALLTSIVFILPVHAKTITDDKSGVLIDLPDGKGWKIEEGKTTKAIHEEGVTLVIMRFERDLPSTVMKRISDYFIPLMKDAKIGDDADKVAIHGMQVDKFSGYGTRDEKPVKFTAILICKDSASTLAVIAFGDETAFKRHLRDIDAAIDSARPKN